MSRTILGKLPREAIGLLELPTLPADLVEGFLSLPDLTGMTADALDQIDLSGAIPASILKPIDPGARIVGRALTVKNVPSAGTIADAVARGASHLGEIEAHNLAEKGDVLVVDGVDGVSNVGGICASIGHRQGEIGAIVDGGVRDIDHSRSIGFPIWARSVSPITGKWRATTIAINKSVKIAGVDVAPGDLVVADEVGVCFVPRAHVPEVLEIALALKARERARQADISRGVSIADLANAKRSYGKDEK